MAPKLLRVAFVFAFLTCLASIISETLAQPSDVGLIGEFSDLVMNGPNIGMPDFFIYPKQNGNRTGQYYRFTADYVALINTSEATPFYIYGWGGPVSEIAKYDLLSPSLVWTRQDNVNTFNGDAENVQFCSLLENNSTICVDYWLFVNPSGILFNFTGQPRGFVYYYELPANSFKFGVTVKNWHRDNPSEWFRLSVNAYSSAPLWKDNSVIYENSWVVAMEPLSTTAALLNLTLLDFVEEQGQLKFLVWTHNTTIYDSDTHTAQGYHHFLDADINSSLYYDPDMRTFFNDVPGVGGGSSDTVMIVLVSVLVPVAVVGVVAGVGAVVGGLWIKNKVAKKRAEQKLEEVGTQLHSRTTTTLEDQLDT